MITFKALLPAFMLSFAFTSTASAAYQVYPGCAVPAEKAGRIFYVDPAKGQKTGDGSAQKPWRTLAEVMNKPPAFMAGDTIYLMNGNHERPSLKTKNDGFVKVMAAPGQKPRLTGLTITGSKWIVSNLDIHSVRSESNGSAYVNVGSGATDVIIDNNDIYSVADLGNMTQAEVRANFLNGVSLDGRGGASCLSVTNNRISKTMGAAVGLMAKNTLLARNVIDNFFGDGIDFGADNLEISDNRITNVNDPGNGQHLDGMQGFQSGGAGFTQDSFKNIVITRNTVIRQTDPNVKFPTYMQGISTFNNDWYNITVSNNVIITNAYQGMHWGSVHGGRFVNNTVLLDGFKNSYGGGNTVWISIGDKTYTGKPTNDIVVANNITDYLTISSDDPSIKVSDNVANGMSMIVNGKTAWFKKPGSYGDNNVIPAANVTANFMAFKPEAFVYDLRLKPASVVIGTADAAVAPPVDINSSVRTMPADPGAYTKPITKAYQGQIKLLANARQNGTPKLHVIVNGVDLGTQEVKANVAIGQVTYYTFDYNLPSKPEKVEIVMEGYGEKAVKSQQVAIFNLDLYAGGKRYGLRKVLPSKVTKGTVVDETGLSFFTNGSTFEINTAGLPL